jgi:hypothetical protein
MVNTTETQDLEATRSMIFVDIALAAGDYIFARNYRRVVNHDPSGRDRIKERNNR